MNLKFDAKSSKIVSGLAKKFNITESQVVQAGLTMLFMMSDGFGPLDSIYKEGRTMFLLIDDGETIIDAIHKNLI